MGVSINFLVYTIYSYLVDQSSKRILTNVENIGFNKKYSREVERYEA